MLFRTLIFTLILTAPVMIPAAQAVNYIEIEQAHEVNASQIRIPSAGIGVLRVETCEDCKKLSLKLTSETRAFVGKQAITIRQFRNLATANEAAAYVFYKPSTNEVTRLVLDMPGLN